MLFRSGRVLLVEAARDSLVAMDFTTGNPLQTFKNIGSVSSAVCHPQRKVILMIREENVELWNLENAQKVLSLPLPKEMSGINFTGLAFSPDGNRLLALNSNGVILTWDGTPLPEQAPRQTAGSAPVPVDKSIKATVNP